MAGRAAGCENGGGKSRAGGRLLWPAPAAAKPLNPRRRPLSWLAVSAIRGYQASLSRLWPNVCRYHPSCSNYTLHAIASRGLVMGCVLGAWRILRCNPFSGGGYDPPPGYEDAVREEERERCQQREKF